MYPSAGSSLLPTVLRPLLGDMPIGVAARRAGLPETTTFGELGQDVWGRLPASTISDLARVVVAALRQQSLDSVAKRPVFVGGCRLEDLDLGVRARHALSNSRFVGSGTVVEATVGELMLLPNFGVATLLDVLVQDERRVRLGGSESKTSQVQRTQSAAVRRVAGELGRKRWATRISKDDPRFGHDLTLLDLGAQSPREAAQALARLTYTPSEARSTVAAIRRFICEVDDSRTLTLEKELEQIVGALTGRETARLAVLARLGLSGQEPLTLELAGRSVGVTRERVRQIERKFREQVAKCAAIWTPVLDRALQLGGELLPISVSDLERSLRDSEIIGSEFSVGSLLSAAEVFGRQLPFAVRNDGAGGLAPIGDWAPVSVVRSTARRLVEHWGATTVDDLAARLVAQGFDVEPRLLSSTLESLDGFRWLDPTHEWFWMKGTRNRILNLIEKIMSVAGSIEVAELRVGVGRHHRMKGFRPPRRVLASLCVDCGLYRQDGTRILGGEDLPDWRDVLGRNERLLAEALFDAGPVMRREDLENLVVGQRGLNRSSFYVYLTYSPIIERYAPGVFGLRGARVSAAQVDSLIPPRVRHQVLQDHGWTDAGHLWAAFRISPASESTGILGAPAAVRAVTSGSFDLLAEDGSAVGTLVIEQNMWGLTPYFRRWGVESGDYVVISLDLSSRVATIIAGTEELLLKFQAGE